MISPTQLTAIVAATRAEDRRRAGDPGRRHARRSRRRSVAAVVALALAALGCGTAVVAPPPPPEPPVPPVVPPLPSDATFTREAPLIFSAIGVYWTRTLPELAGASYEPLAEVVPYNPEDPSTWAECGGERLGPEHNAFYCFTNNTLAYDRPFAKAIYERVGDAAVAAMFAHEVGHQIQDQLDIDGDSLPMEVQADCFAGSWMGWMRDNGALEIGDEQEIADILVAIADPRPDRAKQPDGHGNAKERVTAFALGLDGGAGACVELLPPAGAQETVR